VTLSAPSRGASAHSVEPPARSPYVLPPWGILVIRCEEKTVITDNGDFVSHRFRHPTYARLLPLKE